MCLAQGHNARTLVRLEPAAHLSRVKHSTTEPLRSQTVINAINTEIFPWSLMSLIARSKLKTQLYSLSIILTNPSSVEILVF